MTRTRDGNLVMQSSQLYRRVPRLTSLVALIASMAVLMSCTALTSCSNTRPVAQQEQPAALDPEALLRDPTSGTATIEYARDGESDSQSGSAIYVTSENWELDVPTFLRRVNGTEYVPVGDGSYYEQLPPTDVFDVNYTDPSSLAALLLSHFLRVSTAQLLDGSNLADHEIRVDEDRILITYNNTSIRQEPLPVQIELTTFAGHVTEVAVRSTSTKLTRDGALGSLESVFHARLTYPGSSEITKLPIPQRLTPRVS